MEKLGNLPAEYSWVTVLPVSASQLLVTREAKGYVCIMSAHRVHSGLQNLREESEFLEMFKSK